MTCPGTNRGRWSPSGIFEVTGWPDTLWLTQQDRTDEDTAIFGQADFALAPRLKLLVAGRVDEGSLIERQFSPRAALRDASS